MSEQSTDLEQRIADLERWITHLDRSNADLSDMVAQQWDVIDRLTRTVTALHGRLQTIEPDIESYKPPHY